MNFKTIKDKIRFIIGFVSQSFYFKELGGKGDFMWKAFYAQKFNGISGDYVEFGCCNASTFAMAYQEIKKNEMSCKLWAFDSFKGFPESENPKDEHPFWKKGSMEMSEDMFHHVCKINQVPRNAYETIPGFYDDSLSENSPHYQKLPNDICIAYIDCDMYTSTIAVFNYLKSRLKHGMILAFDDYFTYSSSTISGERKAFLEMKKELTQFHFEPFVQFGWAGMSFIIEEKRLIDESVES